MMQIAGQSDALAYIRQARDLPAGPALHVVSGQSNATGRGAAADLPTLPTDLSASQSMQWSWWYTTTNMSSGMVDVAPVVAPYHGIELSLAHALTGGGRASDVICNASLSAAGMANWQGAGALMWDTLLARVAAVQSSTGISGVASFTWIQGENDAKDSAKAAAYQSELQWMINNLRTTWSSPDMQCYVIRLNTLNPSTYASTVRAAQVAVAAATDGVDLVDVDGMEMNSSSNIHYASRSLVTMGERIAERILHRSHYRACAWLLGAWLGGESAASDNRAWHTSAFGSAQSSTAYVVLYDGSAITQATGALSGWVAADGSLLVAPPSGGATFIFDAAPSAQDIARIQSWAATTLGVGA